ncbi:MAG: hypothetical protein J0I98_19430 [Mesorhizobium sp.]|nr:hypothetical protein [Mesorhizobium sp.]MBN9244957.1 hypothetical protein [Mesorhizobium sp.]MBN9272483.1 hypothetical protein [Mesorhizobium sp.]
MGFVGSLIAGLASGETAAALRRARLAAIVYACAGLLALVGAGFLVGAFYIWTARRYGPIEAAAGFGIGFLVVAGLILLVFRLSAGSRAKQRERRRKADLTALGVTTALALLPTLARGKGGLGLILGPAAALAAYAIYRENSGHEPDDPDPGAGI